MASKNGVIFKWGTPIRTTFWFTVPWFSSAIGGAEIELRSSRSPGIAGTNGTIGIDLPILGWLDKMLGSTVPAVVDVVPVLVTFSEKLYETRKRDTHTHTLDPVFSTT